MNDQYKTYIEYCLETLIERTDEALSDSMKEKNEFSNGRSAGYNEALSFLIKQLEVFQISESLNDKIKNFTPPY